MRATIDKAGRLVIPKPLRDQLGIRPGEVEVVADGATLRVEPVSGTAVIERGGRLIIPAAGESLSGEEVQSLRDADQRQAARSAGGHERRRGPRGCRP